MLLVISGTPGTGKTIIGKKVAKLLGAKLITTGLLVKKYKISAFQMKREEFIGYCNKLLEETSAEEIMNQQFGLYEKMQSSGIPAEDARFILPLYIIQIIF